MRKLLKKLKEDKKAAFIYICTIAVAALPLCLIAVRWFHTNTEGQETSLTRIQGGVFESLPVCDELKNATLVGVDDIFRGKIYVCLLPMCEVVLENSAERCEKASLFFPKAVWVDFYTRGADSYLSVRYAVDSTGAGYDALYQMKDIYLKELKWHLEGHC